MDPLDLKKEMANHKIRIVEVNDHGNKTYKLQKERKFVGWTPLWVLAGGNDNVHSTLREAEESAEKYILGKKVTVVKSY